MQAIPEGEFLIAALLDKLTRNFKIFGIPGFETFRIVQDKKLIF